MAIVVSGNICVPIDKDADKDLLKKLLKSSNSDTLIYSKKYLPFFSDKKTKLKVNLSCLEETDKKISAGQKLKNNHQFFN